MKFAIVALAMGMAVAAPAHGRHRGYEVGPAGPRLLQQAKAARERENRKLREQLKVAQEKVENQAREAARKLKEEEEAAAKALADSEAARSAGAAEQEKDHDKEDDETGTAAVDDVLVATGADTESAPSAPAAAESKPEPKEEASKQTAAPKAAKPADAPVPAEAAGAAGASPDTAHEESLKAKIDRMRSKLDVEATLSIPAALKAIAKMLETPVDGALPQQADALDKACSALKLKVEQVTAYLEIGGGSEMQEELSVPVTLKQASEMMGTPWNNNGSLSQQADVLDKERVALKAKVDRIKAELELPEEASVPAAIKQATEMMGMTMDAAMSLPKKADALIDAIGC